MKHVGSMLIILITLLVIGEIQGKSKVLIDGFNSQFHGKLKNKKQSNGCKLLATKWGIAGWNDNEIKYLDSHKIKCPDNHALKYIRLFSNKKSEKLKKGSWSMRFKFICCRVQTHDCQEKKSKSVTGNNAYTLAMIGKVGCGCDKVMTSYHINTKLNKFGKYPTTRIRINCCNIYKKGIKKFKIVSRTSGYRGSGFGRNVYLGRHPINCGKHGFITNIRSVTKTKNETGINPYFRMNYNCLVPIIKAGKNARLNGTNNQKRIQKHVKSIMRILNIKTNKIPQIEINKINRKFCIKY